MEADRCDGSEESPVLRLTWNDVAVPGSRTVRRLHQILTSRAP
jgi:hypothetical protein